jgi:hypothetical protein
MKDGKAQKSCLGILKAKPRWKRIEHEEPVLEDREEM